MSDAHRVQRSHKSSICLSHRAYMATLATSASAMRSTSSSRAERNAFSARYASTAPILGGIRPRTSAAIVETVFCSDGENARLRHWSAMKSVSFNAPCVFKLNVPSSSSSSEDWESGTRLARHSCRFKAYKAKFWKTQKASSHHPYLHGYTLKRKKRSETLKEESFLVIV